MKEGVREEDLKHYFFERDERKLYPKSVIEGSLSEKDKMNIEKRYKKHKEITLPPSSPGKE